MKKTTALLAGAALMMLTASAWATPITGTINFTGSELLTQSPTDVQNASGMDFSNSAVRGTGSGIYAGITAGTSVAFTDFAFKPSLDPIGINPLWILTYLDTTYSFDLKSINTQIQDESFLVLKGTGILHATGFEDTAGLWFYSTQDEGTTFSAESRESAPVPEPGTLMLLGAGCFGFAIYGKRRNNEVGSCHA